MATLSYVHLTTLVLWSLSGVPGGKAQLYAPYTKTKYSNHLDWGVKQVAANGTYFISVTADFDTYVDAQLRVYTNNRLLFSVYADRQRTSAAVAVWLEKFTTVRVSASNHIPGNGSMLSVALLSKVRRPYLARLDGEYIVEQGHSVPFPSIYRHGQWDAISYVRTEVIIGARGLYWIMLRPRPQLGSNTQLEFILHRNGSDLPQFRISAQRGRAVSASAAFSLQGSDMTAKILLKNVLPVSSTLLNDTLFSLVYLHRNNYVALTSKTSQERDSEQHMDIPRYMDTSRPIEWDHHLTLSGLQVLNKIYIRIPLTGTYLISVRPSSVNLVLDLMKDTDILWTFYSEGDPSGEAFAQILQADDMLWVRRHPRQFYHNTLLSIVLIHTL